MASHRIGATAGSASRFAGTASGVRRPKCHHAIGAVTTVQAIEIAAASPTRRAAAARRGRSRRPPRTRAGTRDRRARADRTRAPPPRRTPAGATAAPGATRATPPTRGLPPRRRAQSTGRPRHQHVGRRHAPAARRAGMPMTPHDAEHDERERDQEGDVLAAHGDDVVQPARAQALPLGDTAARSVSPSAMPATSARAGDGAGAAPGGART